MSAVVSKSKWREGKYGFHYRDVGKFVIQVYWKDGAYTAQFEDRTLTYKCSDVSSAKKAGEEMAREILKRALDSLEEQP